MIATDVVCPAGELTHGTLSHNEHDIRCRADGMLMDASTAPCIDGLCYIRCPVWRLHKESHWANKRTAAPEMVHAGR